MADDFKVLDQIEPAAATLTAGVAVPASHSWIVGSIWVCNLSPVGTSFRIAVSPAAAAIVNKHYLYFGTPIPGNETLQIVGGPTLAATDIFRVYAELATLSFNFFGDEVDA